MYRVSGDVALGGFPRTRSYDDLHKHANILSRLKCEKKRKTKQLDGRTGGRKEMYFSLIVVTTDTSVTT